MDILLVGLNYKTAPLEVRERLAFNDSEIAAALPEARACLRADEVMLLSTCNRVEVIVARHARARDTISSQSRLEACTTISSQSRLEACTTISSQSRLEACTTMERHGHDDEPVTGEKVFRLLGELRGASADFNLPDDALYECRGEEAARHVIRLATGLDSMVLGENQILGQMKQAFAAASSAGTAGRYISKMLHLAFRAGKRVQTDTELGAGGVSVASVAVTLAGKVFGDFSAHTALVIGAGEMAEMAARHFREKGIGNLLFVNRSPEKADRLALEFDGEAMRFDQLLDAVELADIVISSTAAPGLILSRAQFLSVMSRRHTRPIFLVDIAVPHDIDPAINDYDNAFVYDIDSLLQVTDRNLERRRAAIPDAEALVEEELASFQRWADNLRVEPLVKELHEHFDAVRRCEVQKNLKRFCNKEERDLEKLTLLIQKKILHRPGEILRRYDPDTEEGQRAIEIIRDLFGLQ